MDERETKEAPKWFENFQEHLLHAIAGGLLSQARHTRSRPHSRVYTKQYADGRQRQTHWRRKNGLAAPAHHHPKPQPSSHARARLGQ